jgi:predicted dehydrogenase
MKPLDRRSFLTQTALWTGAATLSTGLRPSVWAAPAGANDALRLGLIGLGNKGLGHLRQVAKRPDVRVTALCDVDPQLLARAGEAMPAGRPAPFTTTDARALLARADVDAVIIATCNHWHALHAVWACQAGKDVYVEKPMTHTVWEGRKMIEAATKYGRVVQVGTQYRSETGLAEGIKFLQAGQLGKLRFVHAVVYGLRGPLTRRAPWYPDWLDYGMFCGPTPMVPLEREKLHYDWHWVWTTGNGDLGNNGVHVLDVARRILGAGPAPRRVLGLGGRFVHDDPAETPNAQLAVFDYPEAPVIFEHRGLAAKPGVNFVDQVSGVRTGVVAHCEGGRLAGLTGCTAYDPAGKKIRDFPGDGGAGHLDNFLAAVRSRRPQELAAPVEVGHASAALCHFGNISCRLGEPAAPDRVAGALESVPAAAALGRSLMDHLGVHGVDLAKRPLSLGPWLEIEPSGDGVARVAGGSEAVLASARQLVHEPQRPPYVIPDAV